MCNPFLQSTFYNRFGHLYDLSRTMDPTLLSSVTARLFFPSPEDRDWYGGEQVWLHTHQAPYPSLSPLLSDSLSELIQQIRETTEVQRFFVNQQCSGQVCNCGVCVCMCVGGVGV